MDCLLHLFSSFFFPGLSSPARCVQSWPARVDERIDRKKSSEKIVRYGYGVGSVGFGRPVVDGTVACRAAPQAAGTAALDQRRGWRRHHNRLLHCIIDIHQRRDATRRSTRPLRRMFPFGAPQGKDRFGLSRSE